jgi:hypothetical protein
MSYLIYDEQPRGLEDFLKAVRQYMAWYDRTYLE